jgi:thioredoxin-related protein
MKLRPLAVLLAVLLARLGGVLPAQEPARPLPLAPAAVQDPQGPAKKPAPIYDEAADAEQLVEAAMARARKENRRVLLMYGGNWCGWCFKLDGTLKQDPKLRRKMMYEYDLVHVDIGRGDKHAALSARFGSEHKKHGYPYLTVIDGGGRTIAHQDTAELEDGPVHDPAKVLAFLEAHQAEPRDACEVLEAAREVAKAEGRRLFVHLGAPWCGWCHRLEDWMARPEIAALLAKDFVDVKIDQDRMRNGRLVAALLRQGKAGGIPWMVLMDDALQPLATSDGPTGNTGYPVKPEEIEHFIGMLRTVKRNLSEEDLATLEASLRAAAK